MNHAHLFLIFVAMILTWLLGFYAGDHHAENREFGFWPEGASVLLIFACVLGVLLTLFFIIYPLV